MTFFLYNGISPDRSLNAGQFQHKVDEICITLYLITKGTVDEAWKYRLTFVIKAVAIRHTTR
jgi:hypothetical protein